MLCGMDVRTAIVEIAPGMRLRAWRTKDEDDLVLHADDPAVPRGLSDRFPHPYTRADARAFLSGDVVDLRAPVFAIEIDGRACGGIGAHPGAGERAVGAELGYWLGRRHWGRGHMTRVVAAFAPWVMQALALERLQAAVHADNPASARVLQKTGFTREAVLRRAVRKQGVVRDLHLYARLRD